MNYWIVVVDDEAISLTNARNMLGREQMRVSCLRSGSDLLKFMEKNSPDLILLDILMPDMDGFETFHALRRFEDQTGRAHIPVIFLTGENDSATEKRGLEMGASDFIRKPFNKEIIIKRIENTIRNSRTIETLTEEAKVDRLTGFLNKSHGTEKLSGLCQKMTGALLIMDLDNFKLVNDLCGHDKGDRILKAFSDIVRKNTHGCENVSRIGGDEFLAFIDGITEEKDLATLSSGLNEMLKDEADRILGKDHGIPLGVSTGAVMVPQNGRDYESLFTYADSALYSVKNNGKHSYCIYSAQNGDNDFEHMDPDKKLERFISIIEERNRNDGALLLGSDPFALIYRFTVRFCKRYGGHIALLLLSISSESADNDRLSEICSSFSVILQKTLRMSDMITQNGANTFLIMMTEPSKSKAKGAIERISEEWENAGYAKEAKLEHALKYFDEGI
ncbi:MAG: diguanylate cyclase [Lachnospiraceae bacterium]|nr:diguanylate cyclase [Lachnospiraceae bacterium]